MSPLNTTKVLAFTLALAACDGPPSTREAVVPPLPAEEAEGSTAAPDSRPLALGWKEDARTAQETAILADNETGCEYLVLSSYPGGKAITPRMNRTGQQICRGVTP